MPVPTVFVLSPLAPPRRDIARLLRFALVGASGTLVDVGLLFLLNGVFGLPLLPANVTSYLAGVVNNYTLNRWWTYGDRPSAAVGRQFGQFLLISTVGLVLNTLIVTVLAPPLGLWVGATAGGAVLAKGVATGGVLFWNFFANHLWTFAPRKDQS